MQLSVKFVVHDKQRLECNELSNSRLFIVDSSTKLHLYLSSNFINETQKHIFV